MCKIDVELSFGVGGGVESNVGGREESSWEEGGRQRTGEVVRGGVSRDAAA